MYNAIIHSATTQSTKPRATKTNTAKTKTTETRTTTRKTKAKTTTQPKTMIMTKEANHVTTNGSRNSIAFFTRRTQRRTTRTKVMETTKT